jgi:hypothetical protein
MSNRLRNLRIENERLRRVPVPASNRPLGWEGVEGGVYLDSWEDPSVVLELAFGGCWVEYPYPLLIRPARRSKPNLARLDADSDIKRSGYSYEACGAKRVPEYRR